MVADAAAGWTSMHGILSEHAWSANNQHESMGTGAV